MTPEERMDRIVEEQRALRDRLTHLDAQITVLRAQVRDPLTPSDTDTATSTPPPVPAPPLSIAKAQALPPPLPVAVRPEKETPAPVVPPPPPPEVRTQVPSAKPPAVAPPLPATASATPTSKSPAELEMWIGQVWFVRIGIAAILTGLVLGSIYAYQNRRIRNLPPEWKVLALYFFSGVLTSIGLWMERKKDNLRGFGKVLTAGGLAAIYYVTFAMHYVERLQVVQSTLVGGLLLVLCAFGIFAYAHYRKDQTVATMSLVLGYYASSINSIGWFSLFSNLLLTVGGLWLLWRHRWTLLGPLSLVGCYGGFAFWQYTLPLLTTGGLAPTDYWAGQGFLISCWVLFTTAFVLVKAELLKMPARAVLAAVNHGAFFSLFLIALIAKVPEGATVNAISLFAAVWAVALLLISWLAERIHGRAGRAMGETSQAFALSQIMLVCALQLSGYQLATVWATLAVMLAWTGHRFDRLIPKLGALLLAALVVLMNFYAYLGHSMGVNLGDAPIESLQGWAQARWAPWAQAVLLLLASWFARAKATPSAPSAVGPNKGISPHAIMLGVAAWLAWLPGSVFPVEHWHQPALLLAFAGAVLVASHPKLLNFPELHLVGSISSGFFCFLALLHTGALIDLYRGWGVTPITATILAVSLLVLAWLAQQKSDGDPTAPSAEQDFRTIALGSIALLLWSTVTVWPLQQWWQPSAFLLACGALLLLSRFTSLGLSVLKWVAHTGALIGTLLILRVSFLGISVPATSLEIIGAACQTILLLIAAWLSKSPPATNSQKEPPVSGISLIYAATAVLGLVMVVTMPWERSLYLALWAMICAGFQFLSKLPKIDLRELTIASALMALPVTGAQLIVPTNGERDLLLLIIFGIQVAIALWPGAAGVAKSSLAPVTRILAISQALASYFFFWHFHFPVYFPVAVAALGLVFALLAHRRIYQAGAWFAVCLTGVGLLSFILGMFGGLPYPSQSWGWIVPLLVILVSEFLKSSPIPGVQASRVWLSVSAIIGLWLWVTFHWLADGSYRTIAWAGLALVVFSLGILLRGSAYRRCGLALLLVALGRIVVYDVWQLETAARFISFLVLGGVLVAIGFFYNRFEQLIRKYW